MKRRNSSETFTGIAMACFSGGYLLAPLLMKSSLYQYCGRRGAAQSSLLHLSAALLLYSLAYFIPDRYPSLFGVASAMTRALEGLGSGGSITAITRSYRKYSLTNADWSSLRGTSEAVWATVWEPWSAQASTSAWVTSESSSPFLFSLSPLFSSCSDSSKTERTTVFVKWALPSAVGTC